MLKRMDEKHGTNFLEQFDEQFRKDLRDVYGGDEIDDEASQFAADPFEDDDVIQEDETPQ